MEISSTLVWSIPLGHCFGLALFLWLQVPFWFSFPRSNPKFKLALLLQSPTLPLQGEPYESG
jgi:hypothetical protein